VRREDHRNEGGVAKHGSDKDKVGSMNIRPEELAERYFADNGASYDRIARVSTLGLDGWWKHKILKKLPAAPQRILEQASGTGILTCKIARRYPSCRVIGVELQEDYLRIARKKVRDLDLRNVEFIHGRAESVLLEGEFDCIVSDYLAKYVDLDLLVAHAWRMLRPGGLLVMHELTRPTRPLFVALWNAHFKVLQAYGRWGHPEWSVAFNDVPALLARTRWVDELSQALRAHRFSNIEIENQLFGASVLVSANK
jgi:demethylmenaquinone methyltransferase / 2-methoxy-6-polyprenyl-1,4-benzoquinol methylase